MSHGSGAAVVAAVIQLTWALAAAFLAALATRRLPEERSAPWRWIAVACAAWAVSGALRGVEGTLGHGHPLLALALAAMTLTVPLACALALVRHPAFRATKAATWGWLFGDAIAIALAALVGTWNLPALRLWRQHFGSPEVVVEFESAMVSAVLVVASGLLMVQCRGRSQLVQPRRLLLGIAAAASANVLHCSAGVLSYPILVPAAAVLWAVGFTLIGYAAVGESAGQRRAEVPEAGKLEPRYFHNSLHASVVAAAIAIGVQWLAGQPVDGGSVVVLTGLAVMAHVHARVLLRDSLRMHAQLDRQEAERRELVRRDALTGLPNREAFRSLIKEALRVRGQQPVSVVNLRPNQSQLLQHLDAEQFDAVALELARRIGGCLGPGDALARVSETTFAALVLGGSDAAIGFVRDVLLAIELPVQAGNVKVHLSLAAGLATTPPPGEPDPEPPALAQQATIALGTVATTPGGVALFTEEMLKSHNAGLRLQEAVIQTLREEPDSAIKVMFEPVIELASGEIIGVAARAEWHNREFPAIPAGHLIALAREAGLAETVDYAALRTAIQAFAGWRRRWPKMCQRLWLTVCAETLVNDEVDFADRLAEVLGDAGIPGEALVLDSLDGTAVPAAALRRLRRIRQAGVHIAASDALVIGKSAGPAGPAGPADRVRDLDGGSDLDLGSRDQIADYFDISPVLVEACVDDLRARRLVQATVEFAATRAAGTNARQVARVAQHERLRELGVTAARGRLYAAPMSLKAAEELLEQAAIGTWDTPVRREAQRRRSSQAWKELRQVIRGLPIATFACDSEGKLVLAEGALFDQLALAQGELDHHLGQLFHASDGPNPKLPLEVPLQRALRGGHSVTTFPIRNQWLQVHLSPRRDAARAITGVLGVAIDITHRIQAEQALRSSERRFREVFDQAPVGMIIIALDGRILHANPAISGMLGRTPNELVGRPVNALRHPDSPDSSWDKDEALRTGVITSYCAEWTFRHRDDSPVFTRVTFGALSEGAVPGTTLGIVEDLRQVKQLEVELRHAQKLEAVGMLAAGIAHEINTPIQFINDNTSFLAHAYQQVTRVLDTATRLIPAAGDDAKRELTAVSDEADLAWILEEIPKAAQHSLEGVSQVADIVRAMRNFGHPDQRERALVDVNNAIRDTAIIAHNEVKHVAELHLDLDDVPQIMGFQSEINQVILNLLVNASHAIADADRGRGNIRVTTRADDAAVQITIRDDGCGMSEEVKARIFDPFFTTKEVGRGTGQGLTITYSAVVEKHHGTISVDSVRGEGTTFTIRLPLPEDEDFDFDFDF